MTDTTDWPPLDIHTMFGPNLAPPVGLDVKAIEAFARFALEAFIGQIAIAFGGISIAGWKPFDFLAEWGQARIDEASANYIAATTAQAGANYANAQLTGLLVTDVSGGVALFSSFDGAAASSLGVDWTQAYIGPGGGTLGVDGAGNAAWNASGGFWHGCLAVRNTPLTTDYQRARIVVSQPLDPPHLGGTPGLYILLRANSTATQATFIRLSSSQLAIGYWNSGTETVLDSVSFTAVVGDVIDFYAGTPTDDRQFIVKRNGTTVRTYTDTGAATYMGAGYLRAGLAAIATDKNALTAQALPGKVTAWAAIDRQVTTV